MAKHTADKTSPPSTGTTYSLPEIADIRTIDMLAEHCSQLSLLDDTITIDASHIVRLTTPAMQLLVALSAECEAKETQLHITAPSDACIAAFEEGGLSSVLSGWRTANE